MAGIVELNHGYYFDPVRSRSIGLGSVFIGEPDLDPEIEANRVTVTLVQEDGTEVEILPAAQPLLLNAGGGVTFNGSPVRIFTDRNHSLKVLDRNSVQKYFIENSLLNTGETVSSIAELKAVSSAFDGQSIFVTGYFADSDGGGGHYQFDSSSIEADNSGTVIAPDVGSGNWILSATSPVFVNQFGAKGVATDDTVALQAAFDAGVSDFLPGVYATTAILTITVFPMILRGPGGKDTDVTTALSNNTAIIYATGAQTHIIEWSAGGVDFENQGSFIDGIVIASDASVSNQHAIIFKKRMQELGIERSAFSNITGYGLAWDPTETNDGQNLSIRDVTFRNVGGALGLTAEPANSANYLACTLLTIDNVNLDEVINAVSPQTYMWDLRAFREVVIHNFLTEGANDAAGPDDVVAIANNTWVLIEGWHNEWSANLPTNFLTVFADPNNKFLNSPETIIEINNIGTGGSVLKIEDNTEPTVLLRTPSNFNATSITDIVNLVTPTVANISPRIIIEDIQAAALWPQDENTRGFIETRSQTSRNLNYQTSRKATKLVSWRPSDGSLLTFDSTFLDMSAVTVASSAIEADTTDARINVQRATSDVGSVSEFRYDVVIPTSMQGSLMTFVIRYYQEINAADVGTRFLILTSNASINPGSLANNLEVQNAWATGIFTFNPSAATSRVFSRFIGTAPTVAVITRIASLDIYLGTDYEEPLDLEHPNLQGSATWDPGSIANGAEEAQAITVAGAVLGDFVLVSFSLDVTDLSLTGQVTAANTVTATLYNNTGGAIDLASGTVSAKVIRI